VSEKDLDNLETALQELMDQGDRALIPSIARAGLKQVVVGNRFHDPDWVAINLNQKTTSRQPSIKLPA
jgi:hypothetical protein